MRYPMLIAAVLLASPGCAPSTPVDSGPDRQLAGRVAGPPQACINSLPEQNLRIIDQSTLAYGGGRTIYVNHLPGVCSGLQPLNTLIVDAQSGHYCRGDRVRPLEVGSIIPGAWCNLGDWVPYRMP